VSAVTITDLVVHRGGRTVLRSIGCEVPPRSVTGLIGPGGCGKTTLMRAIVGVQMVVSGSVRVLGEPAGAPPLRRRVGYVPQAPAIYADLSVRENLRYFAAVVGGEERRIDELIATLSLRDQADRPVRDLARGERARASLATALLGEPELLVLDEPTFGLDPVLRQDLWSHFRRLAVSGIAVLISSHVMDEAEHCDHLLLLRGGELVVSETPEALRQRTGEQNLEDAFLWLIQQRDER
jgi:ABC-2 type transport system ATP-binding protein